METIKDVGPGLKAFYYYVCKPENESSIKGSVVVLHGAEGYGGRYAPFGDELANNGYAMFAIDHMGHGNSIIENKLGNWSDDKDFYYSAYNAYYLVDKIKKMYPGKPVYLLGDDYGGTMAQYMLGEFDNIFDGIILSSCGKPSGFDKWMFTKVFLKKKLLYDGVKSNGTFKSRVRHLNRHYKPHRTKYDWLNSVPEEVDRFIEDPLAGYVGTVKYYYYQYKYIVSTPNGFKLKKANRALPMLMLGGKDDYITHRGKMIEKLKNYYIGKGFNDVETILYERSRHDVLLEWNKEEVARDIARWIDKRNSVKGYNNENIIENVNKTEVIEAKVTGLGDEKPWDSNNLKEEVPEDDLKLSTRLNKE